MQQHQLEWLNSKTGLQIQFSGNKLSLKPNETLANLTEEKVYPECSETLQLDYNYLAKEDLKQLARHYSREKDFADNYINKINEIEESLRPENVNEKAVAFQALLNQFSRN